MYLKALGQFSSFGWITILDQNILSIVILGLVLFLVTDLGYVCRVDGQQQFCLFLKILGCWIPNFGEV